MIHYSPVAAFLTLLMGALFSTTCHADEPTTTTTTRPTSQPPEKGQYSLFNPVPADQLRGMDTDRPNSTNTPHTIDSGHLQLEIGVIDYSWFREHSSGNNVRVSNDDFGQLNFRLGVLDNLEINAVMEAFNLVQIHNYSPGGSSRAGSFGDTILGAKLNFWGNESGDDVWVTALAIQPQFKFPTARGDVGNGRFEFTVAAPFLMNLPAGFHLGIQAGISHVRDISNAGYVTGFPASISLDRVVIGNLDVYLEYACDPTTQMHVKAAQILDVGGTYPLNGNIVLDAGVNFGLNQASNNIEVLAGVSVRF